MGKKFRRCVLVMALMAVLVPFPSLAMSMGSVPVGHIQADTLDGPHVAVCGLNGNMEMGYYYSIELCAWNGSDSPGTTIPGASVWYDIYNISGDHIAYSGTMTTNDLGRATFSQLINFGPGRFRISAYMSYGGTYYSQLNWEDWSYFDVYEDTGHGSEQCPALVPHGAATCQ